MADRPVPGVAGATLACLFLLVPLPSAAFKGAEHRQLSNLALELALEHVSSDHRALSAALRLELLSPSKLEDRLSFGDLTRAVDFVFHAEKLVPNHQDCGTQLAIPSVCEVCDRSPSSEACDHGILEETERRLRTKRVRYLNRLLAAHRNQSHFDRGAMRKYNTLHDLALEQASSAALRSSAPSATGFAVALRTEAVALHFLEDFFSAGHAATRRGTHEDIASLSLHNRFNRRGLEAAIGRHWRESRLLETARRMAANGGLTVARRSGEDDALGLDSTHPGAPAGLLQDLEPRFYGDGALSTASGRPQLEFLLLAATHSILEVLEAGGVSSTPPSTAQVPGQAAADSRRMRLCYRGWSAEPEAKGLGFRIFQRVKNTAGAEAVRDWPDLGSTCRPWAAALLSASRDEEGPPCWKGVLGDRPAAGAQAAVVLGVYPHPACPEVVAPNGEGYVHWTPGLSLGSAVVRSRDSEVGVRAELDVLLSSVTPAGVHKREGGSVSAETFLQGESSERFLAQLFFVGLSYEERSELESFGASYGGQIPWVWGRLHVNQYLRWDVGLARYRAPHLDSIKPRLGLRYGAGLGFLFLEVGVERAHENDRQAHLEWTTRYSLGLRAQYPLPALGRRPR